MERFTNLGIGLLCFSSSITLWGAAQLVFDKAPASLSTPSIKATAKTTADRHVILSEGKAANKKDEKESVLLSDPAVVAASWGLQRTDAKNAWTVSQGSKDIVVAVIDTGIDVNHKNLKENLWENPGETGRDSKGHDKATNMIDDDGNGYIDDVHGWDFVYNSSNLTDNHGHGTHIAGIIGANGKAGGVSGVSPHVSLMVLKYYDPKASGTNNLKNTIQAIKYAIQMKANIINYSGGGIEFSQDEHDAVKAAGEHGILFVAAAGNEKSNSDEKGKHYYPADYQLSNIISVTAVNQDDSPNVLPSSNFGVRTVDLAAPGENIYSTVPGNKYQLMTGTSQATAFVTGVAALAMAHNRDFTYADVKKYILRTGDEYPTLLSKTGTAKLLNSYKALINMDSGVSATGVKAANASNISPRTFASNHEDRNRTLNTGALENSTGSSTDVNLAHDPTESLALFGKDFIHALGLPSDSAQTATP